MGVTGTNFSKVYTAGAVSAEVPAVSEAASTKVSQEASTNTAEVVSTVPDVVLKEVPAALSKVPGGTHISASEVTGNAAGVTEKNEVEEATAADFKDEAASAAENVFSNIHDAGADVIKEDKSTVE